jgi:hypothetical protein
VYAEGASDSVYFVNAVNNFLSFNFSIVNSSSFDGGLLAPFIYILPVVFSSLFHINIGLTFRLFYLVILLLTGQFIFLISKTLYSEQVGLKISLNYILNPFIFILSVWAGSEEVIMALFFSIFIYFSSKNHIPIAILVIILASFYKYYSILLLPLAILSIENKKTKIYLTIVLICIFSFIGSLLCIFFNKYITHILEYFITSFPLRGKGLYYLFIEYGHISSIDPPWSFVIWLVDILILIIAILKLSKLKGPFKYGILFIIFFLVYPVFFPAYIIIPFVVFVLYIPFSSNIFLRTNFIILPILSFLSEFAFSQVDSPYNLLKIEPTIVLRFLGVLSLLCFYLLLIYWIFTVLNNTNIQNHVGIGEI